MNSNLFAILLWILIGLYGYVNKESNKRIHEHLHTIECATTTECRHDE